MSGALGAPWVLACAALVCGCGHEEGPGPEAAPVVAGRWPDLPAAHRFVDHWNPVEKVDARTLTEGDYRLLIAMLQLDVAERVGLLLGRLEGRPQWVTDAVVARFDRAASVSFMAFFQPPGPIPELFYERMGALAFFREARGAAAGALRSLLALLRRVILGTENIAYPTRSLLRVIGRVSVDDPRDLIAVLDEPTIGATLVSAFDATAGEWNGHREEVVAALVRVLRGTDDTAAGVAVKSLGENNWLDAPVVEAIRARMARVVDPHVREDFERWLGVAESAK